MKQGEHGILGSHVVISQISCRGDAQYSDDGRLTCHVSGRCGGDSESRPAKRIFDAEGSAMVRAVSSIARASVAAVAYFETSTLAEPKPRDSLALY